MLDWFVIQLVVWCQLLYPNASQLSVFRLLHSQLQVGKSDKECLAQYDKQ
jgi:hypothetical protein